MNSGVEELDLELNFTSELGGWVCLLLFQHQLNSRFTRRMKYDFFLFLTELFPSDVSELIDLGEDLFSSFEPASSPVSFFQYVNY